MIPMRIAFAVDRPYLPYCAVTAASVCANLQTGETVVFHVLHGGDITEKDTIAFNRNLEPFKDRYSAEFLPVDDFLDLNHSAASIFGQNPAAYYRLYIPCILHNLDKVLYLEPDVIARHSVRALFEIDCDGFALAGVEDAYARTEAQCLYLSEDARYVNGGVLLWNLREIELSRYKARLKSVLNGNLKYVMNAPDQDILNLVFQGSIRYVSPAWNVQLHSPVESLDGALRLCGVHNNMSENVCRQVFKDPYVIHFVSGKPWRIGRAGGDFCPYWFAYADPMGCHEEKGSESKISDAKVSLLPVASEDVRASIRDDFHQRFVDARKSREFCSSDLTAFGGSRLCCIYPETAVTNGGFYDLFRLVCEKPRIQELVDIEDLDDSDSLVQGYMGSEYALDVQIDVYKKIIQNQQSLYFVELGFIASVLNISMDYTFPLPYRRVYSFAIDDLTFYFDAMLPSRLELYLNSDDSILDEKQKMRCASLIRDIVSNKLTKYTFLTPNVPSVLLSSAPKVLVVDQAYGDASIRRGMADEHTFQLMLQVALEENPEAEIIIKTHPDTLAGMRSCYFATIQEEGRIRRLTESVNPYAMFPYVESVYVCTSHLGFEALMAGKKVVTFGMPAYAGWGLTDDRQYCSRRFRKLCLEELFYGLYIRHSLYFSPYEPKRCSLEEYLGHMVTLRDEYHLYSKHK